MRKIIFPPVESATEDGLVAVGGDLRPDVIEAAYRQGIFPWPISVEFPLAWFSPDPRGVIFLDDLHVPRSLVKFAKKSPYVIKRDISFTEIIKLCATVKRKGQPSTWITPEIVHAYTELFDAGNAWCMGAWEGQRLVGGVYGVKFGEFYSGESMFTVEDNAGKLSLLEMLRVLLDLGIPFMDTQMVTPVTESLGAVEISRSEFIKLIKRLKW